MLKKDRDLRALLEQIDHRSYPAYKQTAGSYSFPEYVLSIDHVQGDPFASPSHITLNVRGRTAGFPAEYYEKRHRRIALQDYLTRRFDRAAGQYDHMARGSGKSGAIETCRPGQEILERTACRIDESTGDIFVRLHIGFPANGRTINSRELIKMLFDFLPKCVHSSLLYSRNIEKETESVIFLSDDQNHIREELKKRGLCAFIADGSILPRKSGISRLPMKEAVPFTSPESLSVQLELPHRGRVSGMGIKKGVTLIAGGGYHGKSTLLSALETGVYDHIAGDGREYVITDPTAMKIRAEDGRSVHGTDISLFINNLPDNRDTAHFFTEDASGSTSQAANVTEAVESGSELLLIDEDTCATNFMIRDELMQKVIVKEQEPITPFIDNIRPLAEKGISTILVAGSFGAYFHLADTIIQMDCYKAVDITERAKEAAREYPLPEGREGSVAKKGLSFQGRIPIITKSFDTGGRIKSKTLGTDGFMLDHDTVELRYVEQLTEAGQLTALSRALMYAMRHYINGRMELSDIIKELSALIEKKGIDGLSEGSYVSEGLSYVRPQELFACFNRCRFINFKPAGSLS
ncbi:MAG TPA: isopentenyl-diphosphate delta-isomerase [Lachnospiraceae bacterium]|nr:isopentenyl-diphosphate delta-isomerase [Lachnospiraceae bacterium]